jgi:hypothetical protein
MNYEFDFRKQFDDNSGGVIATIHFEISQESRDSGKVSILYEAEECWRTACEAGMLIFADYYKRRRRESIKIRIFRVRWLPVDSSNLSLLFATVEGLKQFFGIGIEGLSFDGKSGMFMFPERRRAFNK